LHCRFAIDEAAAKLIYLALRNTTRKWKRPPVTWKKAMSQFAILFTDRLEAIPKPEVTMAIVILGHQQGASAGDRAANPVRLKEHGWNP
jgi:hypothetical protein